MAFASAIILSLAGYQPLLAESSCGRELIAASPADSQSVPAAKPVMDKWAVVIGIDKFHDESIPVLRYASKDASDFARFLVEKGNFAQDHVFLLTNEQATRDNIRDAIGDSFLPRRAAPDDLVLLFASTHGSPKEIDVAGENFLVAYDTDPKKLFTTGIKFADLAPIIKQRTGCDRIVLLLDACNSGAANVGGKGLVRTGNFDISALAGEGQIVISSSSADQRSFESMRYENGVFTRSLMASLQGKGPTTTVTEAFQDLKQQVESEVRFDRKQTQTPVMRSRWKGGELALLAAPARPRHPENDATAATGSLPNPEELCARAEQMLTAKKYSEFREAVPVLTGIAEAGNAGAQFLLGRAYRKGTGVAQDNSKALDWYQKAAEKGHAAAQFDLGELYDQGLGVAQNYGTATQWFQKSADRGLTAGQYAMGFKYHKGQGVPQNYGKAAEWYQKAAEKGDTLSQCLLAMLYEKGQGVPQDYGKAAEWYQKAADRGFASGQFMLGWLYEKGKGVPQNYSKAFEWYEKAAEQGDATAQNNLGSLYDEGNGMPQNRAKAVEWYQKAANQGNDAAQNSLGFSYANGLGVPKNNSLAAEWFQKSADQGNALAQRSLGFMYQNGWGVPKDYSKAREWYGKSANQGNAKAIEDLRNLRSK
jgi:uncharacterized protein